MEDEQPPPGITLAPSPWLNIPISIYLIPLTSSPPLLDHAYAPLEAASPFSSDASSGKFKGGLGTIQVVRYHDTPVGPYDELLLIPGKFEVPGTEGKDGKGNGKGRRKEMLRITRIYVSQKGTAWNGRKNWNIPKHLASFSFTTNPNGTTHLEVSPPSSASTEPFLTLDLTPFRYIPAIPFSTNAAKWIGMDLRLCQPPLPTAPQAQSGGEGEIKNEEVDYLCGTNEWKVAMPEVWGKAKCCRVDLSYSASSSVAQETTPLLGQQRDGEGLDPSRSSGDHWWPAYKTWSVGVFIEDGRINFNDASVEGVGAGGNIL